VTIAQLIEAVRASVGDEQRAWANALCAELDKLCPDDGEEGCDEA
jgi:hypothetical protein